ncbi:MAG: flavin reductase family protein [candidate division WOR-3 bacterium]|nr:flavin reductase family protein [candidate division WOR-3 bacterium]
MASNKINDISKLLSGFAGFPTVLVTCGDNIITVTLVHIFSFSPLLIGIGIKPERYSFGLIKQNKEFVVNIPTKDILPAVKFCGSKSGKIYDKFHETNLTKINSLSLKTVSIKECPINIECQVVQEFVCGDRTWFIGKVVNGRIADNFDVQKTILYWQGKYRLPGEIL